MRTLKGAAPTLLLAVNNIERPSLNIYAKEEGMTGLLWWFYDRTIVVPGEATFNGFLHYYERLHAMHETIGLEVKGFAQVEEKKEIDIVKKLNEILKTLGDV